MYSNTIATREYAWAPSLEVLGGNDVDPSTSDMTKILMSYFKCRSVEVINNSARPGSNHMEINYIIIIIMIKINVKVRGSTNNIRNKYSIKKT